MTARRGASRRWYDRQRHDPYVRGAQAEGYRSRAAYKLIELDARERLLRPGAVVVDLGAAPGSWSQVAVQRVGPRGRVIAVDRLEVAPLAGVEILSGDVTDPHVGVRLRDALPQGADLVLSDLAPNLSGIREVDQAAWLALAELAADLAAGVLKPGGALVIKAFQGPEAAALRVTLAATLGPVQARKPAASRGSSSETYFVARRTR